jgi:hypothetical protein
MPMALGPRTASAKGRLVRAHRRPIDPAEVEDRRRDLAAAKIADYVEKILRDAPELTAQQRTDLVVLLRPARRRNSAAS